jgi:hypothetical protein
MCEADHTRRRQWKLYGSQPFQEEAPMRRLIESLAPGERQIYWKWIGGMFAFYIVVMAAAVGLFATHHSRANLAQEAGATVAGNKRAAAASESRSLMQQFVRFNFN